MDKLEFKAEDFEDVMEYPEMSESTYEHLKEDAARIAQAKFDTWLAAQPDVKLESDGDGGVYLLGAVPVDFAAVPVLGAVRARLVTITIEKLAKK